VLAGMISIEAVSVVMGASILMAATGATRIVLSKQVPVAN
jgi:hypothetical protein